MNLQMIAVFFLVSAAVAGVAWVFLFPILSGERNAAQRRASVAPTARRASARGSSKSRREQVEESLSELEERNRKAKRVSLGVRITRAGLRWSKQRFYLTCAALGLLSVTLLFAFGASPPVILGLGFAASVGVPLWALRFLAKRRENQFIERFPDAVDIIVRGIKAGLPLLDSIKVIVNDSPEPVRSEFRAIVETQAVGIPLGEACGKLYERVPLAEASFFGIVIAIQQKSGGNLSEALGNLSRVLRERKKMKAKIQAMSMEAKASASIIASLPIAVMGLVYISSPDYIMLLFSHSLGHLMLAGSAVWMMMGVLVMRKMINFDF
ncbi:MAG: type II secretion system F family protein [Proteobacteria bacterium]|nr:type II secretion system F family protein [Pseudomonadota bacterium]